MKRNSTYTFLAILMLLALFVTSCSSQKADTIATAVAMTVAAQGTARAQATATPIATEAAPTSTPDTAEVADAVTPTIATFSPPTAPPAANAGPDCIVANLISETIPDGTVMQPNEDFMKTWRIKNNGSCTWNSAYKIVYWSGDLMGGLTEYPFPGVTQPGETADISLYLKAPAANGNYTGYWKLQSEWGGQFGVGQYDQPFYVQINVNDSTNPNYAITNVTYNVVRKPASGCDTNVWYTVNATITSNGPIEISYRWLQSDGNDSKEKTLTFTDASSITLSREWSFHLGASPGTKWMQIVITAPDYYEYPKQTFVYDCQ